MISPSVMVLGVLASTVAAIVIVVLVYWASYFFKCYLPKKRLERAQRRARRPPKEIKNQQILVIIHNCTSGEDFVSIARCREDVEGIATKFWEDGFGDDYCGRIERADWKVLQWKTDRFRLFHFPIEGRVSVMWIKARPSTTSLKFDVSIELIEDKQILRL